MKVKLCPGGWSHDCPASLISFLDTDQGKSLLQTRSEGGDTVGVDAVGVDAVGGDTSLGGDTGGPGLV